MYVHTCTHLTLTLNTQSDAVTHKPWISWPRGQKKGEEEERGRERERHRDLGYREAIVLL